METGHRTQEENMNLLPSEPASWSINTPVLRDGEDLEERREFEKATQAEAGKKDGDGTDAKQGRKAEKYKTKAKEEFGEVQFSKDIPLCGRGRTKCQRSWRSLARTQTQLWRSAGTLLIWIV